MFDWRMIACATTIAVMAGSASIAGAAGTGGAGSNGPVAEASSGYQGKCVLPKTAYRTSATQQTTSSSSYSVLPGAGTKITQGGQKKGCVIVEFTGYGYAPDSGLMFVEATVGGQECSPGPAQFVAESGTFSDAHSMKWVCPKVAPGKHKIKIRWRSGNDEEEIFMTASTTTVYYQ